MRAPSSARPGTGDPSMKVAETSPRSMGCGRGDGAGLADMDGRGGDVTGAFAAMVNAGPRLRVRTGFLSVGTDRVPVAIGARLAGGRTAPGVITPSGFAT